MSEETPSRSPSRAEVSHTAIELAVKQARSEERVLAHLKGHDDDIRELRQGQATMVASLDTVKQSLSRVETALATQAAVTAAGLSTRTYLLGVVAVIASIVAIFFGTGIH